MSHHDCDYCKLSRRVRRTMKNGSRPQMRKLITELMNRLVSVEFDAQYDEAVLNGTWPSAVEILSRSLEKARVVRADRIREEVLKAKQELEEMGALV